MKYRAVKSLGFISAILYLVSAGFPPLCFGYPANSDASKIAGGVSFQVPASWKETTPQSQMRLFQFSIPAPESQAAGEMAVFYFGASQGGAIDANIERWKSQFNPLREGFTPEIKRLEAHGLPLTTVYLEGTYNAGMSMGMASGPQSDYAVWGVIVEGPQGPVFFKAAGPAAVIQNTMKDFETLIQSFKAAS